MTVIAFAGNGNGKLDADAFEQIRLLAKVIPNV
jgi:hypothetical protein